MLISENNINDKLKKTLDPFAKIFSKSPGNNRGTFYS